MDCILSVAEKPSVAKELTAILTKAPPETCRRQGFSPYNHIFDIDRCMFRDRPAKMKMTSVSGHMMELEFDAAYRNWNSCAPVDLFTAPIKREVKKESENIKKTLQTEARKCNILLLWLDCDLEGENIAYEVIKVCTEANPRLDVFRARFSALIERDILRTLKLPDRPNAHFNDAVEARQEIDLRIGAAFTRFQTKRLQKRFANLDKSVISYGPCQFPTLGFVVERVLNIKAFKSEDFWYIQCEGEVPTDKPSQLTTNKNNSNKSNRSNNYNTQNKSIVSFNWKRGHIYDHFTALLFYDACCEIAASNKQNNRTNTNTSTTNAYQIYAQVIHCEENPTSRKKPLPLNTIEFQILASQFLRMSSDHAMNIAESLYQRGIMSYPRTETNSFPDGFEILPLLQDFQGHMVWGEYVRGLLQEDKYDAPRKGTKNDQAHPPIYPTKSIELESLSSADEKAVYSLIAKHFFACCSKDARGSQTTVTITVPAPPTACSDHNSRNSNTFDSNTYDSSSNRMDMDGYDEEADDEEEYEEYEEEYEEVEEEEEEVQVVMMEIEEEADHWMIDENGEPVYVEQLPVPKTQKTQNKTQKTKNQTQNKPKQTQKKPKKTQQTQKQHKQHQPHSSSNSTGTIPVYGIAGDGHGEIFTTTGLMVLEKNWFDIYSPYDSWYGHTLPVLTPGMVFPLTTFLLADGHTSPPPLLSESDLIHLMDTNGIGTDATIATHIATIQGREYASKTAQQLFQPTNLGLALIEGYNAMGYQLNKPQLRAIIESDCQRIARGEVSRVEVVTKCLTTMKECFINCVKEASKLDAAVGKYYPMAGIGGAGMIGGAENGHISGGVGVGGSVGMTTTTTTTAAVVLNEQAYEILHQNLSACGICHEGMMLKQEKTTKNTKETTSTTSTTSTSTTGRDTRKRFLHCLTCAKAYRLPHRGELLQHEVSCPLCSFQVLIVRNPDTKKDHTICPYCYNFPPQPPIGIENADEDNDFRCFQCASVDCTLAGRMMGSEVIIAPCALCQGGQMACKRTTKGAYVISCSNSVTTGCKNQWWLPKFIKTVIPQAGKYCDRCASVYGVQVSKLLCQLILTKAPRGVCPEELVCPVCATLWTNAAIASLPIRKTSNTTNTTHMPPPPVVPSTILLPTMSMVPSSFTGTGTLPRSTPSTTATASSSSMSSFLPPPPSVPVAQSSSHIMMDLTDDYTPPPYQPQQYQQQQYQQPPSSASKASSSSYPSSYSSYQSPPPTNTTSISNTTSSSSGGGSTSTSGSSAYDAALLGINTYKTSGSSSSGMSARKKGGGIGSAGSVVGGSVGSSSMTEDVPCCKCGVSSKLLTVGKEGVNKGRTFYACIRPKEEGCGFFQWTDEPPRTTSTTSSTGNYGGASSASSGGGGGGGGVPPGVDAPLCDCQEATAYRITRKEGANKDRPFFTCASKKCSFFSWADAVGSSSSSSGMSKSGSSFGGGSGSKYSKGSSGGGGGSGGLANITCSRCKQTGHYARSCTQR